MTLRKYWISPKCT